MKTIQLSMSTSYVKHWGLWEALRELLQNALDAKSKGFEMSVEDKTAVSDGLYYLEIHNGGPSLSRKSLLLGCTSKEGDDTQIGQFGEGFKLALLVLCRLGHEVHIDTGNELWTPSLQYSEEFQTDVLTITITEKVLQDDVSPTEGVTFRVFGVQLSDIKQQYKPDLPINTPLKDMPGMMFIQGLFVCHSEGFKYGYNFSPGTIKLDRDRGMIDGFDLAFQTSKIWTSKHYDDEEFGDDILMTLISEQAVDVRYCHYHIPKSSKVEATLVASYSRSYGTAIPVSTQEEIVQAQAAGKKFQLVPETLKDILWRAVGFFIPSIGTTKQRLEGFIVKHKSSMSQTMLSELQDIVGAM